MKIDFAFLIHARSSRDLKKKFKWLPDNEFFLNNILKVLPILNAGPISGIDGMKGIFLGLPMTASQMLANRSRAINSINKAYRIASQLGVRCIGLGGYTGSLSHNGLSISSDKTCIVTTGHAMTAYAVCANALRIASISGKNIQEIRITIVGAAGSIGSGVLSYLSKYFRKFHLIDVRIEILKEIVSNYNDLELSISDDIRSIIDSNIIITATSAPYAVIDKRLANYIPPGAVFIDDAQPLDVDRKIVSQIDDILVIDGGVLHHKDVYYKLDLDMCENGDFFGCMGEAMLVAKYGHNYASVGNIQPEMINKVAKLANIENIRLAKFRADKVFIDEHTIEKVTSKWI